MSSLKTRFAAGRASSLCTNATDAERRLWSRLRNRNLGGFKFVRQQPVGRYIADFACRDADLVVELDGGQHNMGRGPLDDAARTAALARHGYRVIRFWNNDVLANTEGVLQAIAEELEKAPSPGLRFAKSDLSPGGEVGSGHRRATASPLPSGERSAEGRVRGPAASGSGVTGSTI